jgi:uncharacterized protein DUF4372
MVLTASLFNQLLHHFPRTEFGALVRTTKAERHARGFTCWEQFVAMLFLSVGSGGFSATHLQRSELLLGQTETSGDVGSTQQIEFGLRESASTGGAVSAVVLEYIGTISLPIDAGAKSEAVSL